MKDRNRKRGKWTLPPTLMSADNNFSVVITPSISGKPIHAAVDLSRVAVTDYIFAIYYAESNDQLEVSADEALMGGSSNDEDRKNSLLILGLIQARILTSTIMMTEVVTTTI